ncbi:MAG: BlaI/MecI/CopY family transcriptional regulator [bacterium]|nr:BlaI/MecI/CopY family transcriptional regulator [bacterium]
MKKSLTALEWEIMNVIWKLGGSPSVRDVLNFAYPEGEKAYTTVQTIMNILMEKGYLKRNKIGLVNFYVPVRKQNETLMKETENFVNKAFGGSQLALVNHLLETDSLSRKEILDLKKLISGKEKRD